MDQVGRVEEVYRAEHVVHDRRQVVLTQLKKFMLSKNLVQICLFTVHYDKQVLHRLGRVQINLRCDDVENARREYVFLQRR